MTSSYLTFLGKKINVNNMRIPTLLNKKTIPTTSISNKRYEKYKKEYYEHKKLNRLSYENFQKINWRK